MAHTGRVKSWNDDKNYGFIFPDAGGHDVFVHRKVIANGNSLVTGRPVKFDMQMSEDGKPKATMVAGEAVTKTFNNAGKGGFNNNAAAAAAMMQPGMPLTGTVRNWIPEKGYGFITQDNGVGGDVFVMSKHIRGTTLMPGQKVTYTLGTNPKSGKPWAENVTPFFPPAFPDPYTAAQFGAWPPAAMPGFPMAFGY